MEVKRSPLLLINLFNDLETVCPILVDRIASGDILNSFLLAAGAQQIIEDYLHGDPLLLNRAAARFERNLSTRLAWATARSLRVARALMWHAAATRPGNRSVARRRHQLDALVGELAALLDDSCAVGAPFKPALEATAQDLASHVPELPTALRRQLLRLPACFRSFDLAPEDMDALARRFADRWPRREQPLAVVGVRSSGSYLAPLVVAALRRLGYVDVLATTLRPDQRWLYQGAQALRDRARRSGMALVIDDPPLSWESVAGVSRQLGRLGFEPGNVALLLPTFPATAEPPAFLRAHPTVLLPWHEWTIARKLEPEAIHETLTELLQDRSVVLAVRPASSDQRPVCRGHAGAVFDVTVRDGSGERSVAVRARGVGLGYFGEHSLAVAERLSRWLPELYGLGAGVMYEVWEPPERRLREPLTQSEIEAVVGYVFERSRALPLDEDFSARVPFGGVAWLAGQAFDGLFGRASEFGRLLAAALVRRILMIDAPAVIDAQADLERFAMSADAERTIKTDYDAGIFTSLDLFCLDPAFDLAQAAVSALEDQTGQQLRREFEGRTGVALEPERWFLYQFIAINDLEGDRPPEKNHAARRLATVLQRYYGEVLLDGVATHPSGPLCAIDLDGVLDTTLLGFAASSPLGVMALRSLICHGFRPLLVTERSVTELQDRCLAYGLVGGVAEYGAVTYDRQRDRVRVLLSNDERRGLDRLRSFLTHVDGVHLEPGHRCSVRAFRIDTGDRCPLDHQLAEHAIATVAGKGVLRAIHQEDWTDFAAVHADKGLALRSLADDLGVLRHQQKSLAFAVGDTRSDLGMFQLARAAYAPVNADPEVQLAGAKVLNEPNQRALAAAVTSVLGHPPGTCNRCAPRRLSSNTQLFLRLLGVQDAAGWRRAARALALIPFAIPRQAHGSAG